MSDQLTLDNGKGDKVPLRGDIRNVYKKMGKAIADYQMLKDGDRVLVGVSGGVDSLSLIKLFQMRKQRIPISFELVPCFIDTSFIKSDKNAIIAYVKSCGMECVTKDLTIDQGEINCFWCSWNRRKILFETARQYGCNKVALGHNLDDIVETIMMNMFFLGEISAMRPRLEMFKGELSIIRPLCYLEKWEVLNFSSHFSFPINDYKCEYGNRSRRQFVRDMIPMIGKQCSQVKKNIFRSIRRVREEYLV